MQQHKKLLYRSKNRGWKETDIFLGNFAENYLDQLSPQELEEYSKLLDQPDVDIFNWATGKEHPPIEFDNKIMHKLKQFRLA